jgi:hypothetical protein
MRTSSGNGSVYFDDVFFNGIRYTSILFYGFNILISVFNVFLSPILFYATCIQSIYHRNLR